MNKRFTGTDCRDDVIAEAVGGAEWPMVFWINLDRCTDRREAMLAKLRHCGIERQERVAAIDGSTEDDVAKATDDTIAAQVDTKRYREIACTLSHLTAIKRAYDRGLEEAIIMEDDVNFRFYPYWRCTLPQLLAKRPTHATIVQLAWITDEWNFRDRYHNAIRAGQHFAPRRYSMYCAMAYLVTRQAMRMLIERHWLADTGKWHIIDGHGAPLADHLIYRLPNVVTSTMSLFCSDGMDTTVHDSDRDVRFHRQADENHLAYYKTLDQGPTNNGDDGVSESS